MRRPVFLQDFFRSKSVYAAAGLPARVGAGAKPPLQIPASLRLVSLLPCPVGFQGCFHSFPARSLRAEAVLRGFFLVEDGAAGPAHGNTWLDLFGAGRALGHRLGIVEPGLFDAELASGAALKIGDEHRILGALPFEVCGSHQAALKLLEAAARVREFRFGGLRA